MRLRFHMFEFEDLDGLPCVIRDGMTDFLGFLIEVLNYYSPVSNLLAEALLVSNCSQIIDLCSGSGKHFVGLQKELKRSLGGNGFRIILSDKYPNKASFLFLSNKCKKISFENSSVDAIEVPGDLVGFRTIFSAAHHFPPARLKRILRSVVKDKEGIGIFDGGNKSIVLVAIILTIYPLLFIIFTPFIKPMRLSKLFFTYIIPLIPLFTIWDGIASVFRLYEPEEFLQITEEINADHYKWITGKVKNQIGMKVSYLIGYPAEQE